MQHSEPSQRSDGEHKSGTNPNDTQSGTLCSEGSSPYSSPTLCSSPSRLGELNVNNPTKSLSKKKAVPDHVLNNMKRLYAKPTTGYYEDPQLKPSRKLTRPRTTPAVKESNTSYYKLPVYRNEKNLGFRRPLSYEAYLYKFKE